METSREDVGIAIRSAFLKRGTRQGFSLFVLAIFSLLLLFAESIKAKPINYFRSIIKDVIYQGSAIVSSPVKGFGSIINATKYHILLSENYEKLKKDYDQLKNEYVEKDFLKFENKQLRNIIDDQISSSKILISARPMLDKQSPYLNSFIINSGSNKKIKNSLAVLDGQNFIGRTVDVNFFSSRILLVSDLNSRIPVIIEPTGHHAILVGRGEKSPVLEYLPEDHNLSNEDKVYTSGKEGIFSPGIPIGEVEIKDKTFSVSLYSDLTQITFVNIILEDLNNRD